MGFSSSAVDSMWERGSKSQATITYTNTTNKTSNTDGLTQMTNNASLVNNNVKNTYGWINPMGNIAMVVSSSYGNRNLNGHSWHHGVDFGVANVPLYACQNGTVRIVSRNMGNGGRGLYLVVQSDAGGAYLMQHLSSVSVKVGDRVTAGQKIAISGNSGKNSKGGAYAYHLHFECHTTYPITYISDRATTDYNPMKNTYKNISGTTAHTGSGGSTSSSGGSGSSGGSSSGNSYGGGSSYSGYSTDSAGTPVVTVVHTAETKQWYTDYPSDNNGKAVDEYEIALKKWDGDKTYNISDICSDVVLTDSVNETATQLSMTIVQSKLDKYVRYLDIQTGDKISMRNTANDDVVFSGTILTINHQNSGVISISALDNGRLLSTNEVMLRFNNQPIYDVIATIANKCGVSKISCPTFESTFSAIVKGKGSDIIKECLQQVTQENGVNYFARVLGDTVVIKSYANKPIIPYWRSAKNIAVTECLRDASEYNIGIDATGVRSTARVIQSDDSNYSIVATETDNDTETRYGKLTGNVDYQSGDTVSADSKALYTLKYILSKPDETHTITCPASDRIVAGARIAVEIDGDVIEYWVLSVTHDYIPQHICKLTLQKCTATLDTSALRALYSTKEENVSGEIHGGGDDDDN